MSTTKGQRIGIIIIAIVMTVGTLGSFFIMILANDNSNQMDQQRLAQEQELMEQQQKQAEEYQKQQDEIAAKLSPKYYPVLAKYESKPAPFEASKVKKLTTDDLKEGDGQEVKDLSDLNIYYIGWNPSGKMFDSSFNGDKLTAPLDPSIGLITGMNEGIIGMRIGGVRQITIPAEQAYGDQSPSPDIPAGTPLKFIVLAIPPQS